MFSTHPPIVDRINRLRAADRRAAAGRIATSAQALAGLD